MSFRVSVSLILCLEDMPIDIGGVLILLLYSHQFILFVSVGVCFRCSYIRYIYIECYTLSLYWWYYYYIVSFFFLSDVCFRLYFVWYENSYSHFHVIFIDMKYLFLSPHFQSMCVYHLKEGLFKCYFQLILYFFFFLSPFCFFFLSLMIFFVIMI